MDKKSPNLDKSPSLDQKSPNFENIEIEDLLPPLVPLESERLSFPSYNYETQETPLKSPLINSPMISEKEFSEHTEEAFNHDLGIFFDFFN